jgi:hypothetical protein
LYAQPPFENHYGDFNDNDLVSRDYVTCPANRTGEAYVGVSAVEDNTNGRVIRGIIFDASGNHVFPICAGTGICEKMIFLPPNIDSYNEIHPLKIIQMNSLQGYFIVGYIINSITQIAQPFCLKTDNNLDPLTSGFRVFSNHGFFSDVDELANNDLIFCGSQTNDLQVLTSKEGMIICTDATFNVNYFRLTHSFTPGFVAPDFDIVHDLLIINSTDAFICGSVTESYTSGVCTSTAPRPFIARLNLATGSTTGPGYWSNTEMKYSGISLGCRIAFNGSNEVVLVSNSDIINSMGLSFYNATTGAFNYAKAIEFNLKTINDGIVYAHVPFVQNIYYNNNGNLFFSGKLLKVDATWTANYYDMPFAGEYDILNASANGVFYPTDISFPGPIDQLNYWSYTNPCNSASGNFYPFYAASNTIPSILGNGNEFTTITFDHSGNPFRTWIFTNDFSTCNNSSLTCVVASQSSVSAITFNNDDIIAFPDINPLFVGTSENRIKSVICDLDPD